MKVLFFLILGLPILALSITPDTGSTILNNLKQKYMASSDFKASFSQIITYRGLSRKSESTGTIFFKKPNKLKWIQEKPEKSHYISNGKDMWLYMPDDAQAFLNKNIQEVVDKISMLFLNDSNLNKTFNIKIAELGAKNKIVTKPIESTVTTEKITYEFSPNQKDSFSKALITVNTKSLLISKVVIIDLASNKTIVNLNNISFQNNLHEKDFDFTPPKNTTIYKSDK